MALPVAGRVFFSMDGLLGRLVKGVSIEISDCSPDLFSNARK
jgi:hypothetical protein